MRQSRRYKRSIRIWGQAILVVCLLLGITVPALAQDGENPGGGSYGPPLGLGGEGQIPGVAALTGPTAAPQQAAPIPAREQAAVELFMPFVPHTIGEGMEASATQAVMPVDMKVLVIAADGNETDLPYVQGYLRQLGIPFDTLMAATTPLTAAMLANGTKGFYQGVILMTGNLGYYDSAGAWVSAFDQNEWNILWQYEATYGVRQVTSYTAPWGFPETYGLNLVGDVGATEAQPVLGTLTAAGQQVYSDLRATTPVTIENAWVYKACPSSVTAAIPVGSGCPTTVITATTPTTPLLQTAEGYALASIHLYADGRQNLAITIANNPYLLHSLLLSYGTVNWVTKGAFLGERRVMMDPQIDDLFIESDMWSTALLTDTGFLPPEQSLTYRTTGADYNAAIAWQNSVRAKYPVASTLTLEWAFNGEGTTGIYPSDTLTPAVKANTNAFNYLSHTYTHENLDAVTTVTTTAELQQNHNLTTNSRGWFKPSRYTKDAMVQPDISGLGNPNFLLAAKNFGIKYLISDTSRSIWNNPSPNAGFYSQYQPSILIIPRRPTNLFYNLRTPDEWVSEYNCYYSWAPRPGWVDPFNTCASSPWKYWPQDLTYAEIIDKESDLMLQYLLKWDWDPLMFHQANVGAYDGTHSLLGDLIEATLAKYSASYNVPFYSVTGKGMMQTEIGQRVAQRMAYDASGVKATITQCTRLTVTAVKAAKIPVTGLNLSGTNVTKETYAGQTTSYIQMSAGQTRTFTLTCP
jgi:hypothetical protein